ncbi:MAG: hypothetical protein ACRCWQ_08695 [Bacilli bacterium]
MNFSMSRTKYKDKTIIEWGRELDLHPRTIRNRLNKGDAWEDALRPVKGAKSNISGFPDVLARLEEYGNTVVRKKEMPLFRERLEQQGYMIRQAKDGYFIVESGDNYVW